ncbi:MAG: hypothetical protein QM658_00585 [Gordonia sp. (in: high G+C Gram-positive bacteria)]
MTDVHITHDDHVLRNGDARARILTMRSVLGKYRDELAAIDVIAVKPAQEATGA